MAFKSITFRGKSLKVHKAIIQPEFNSKTVLVVNIWDYVELWLKRKQKEKALFYWQQARNFFNASTRLPKTSSPLTTYYSFLNAAKALLLVKGNQIEEKRRETHGVRGETIGERTSLSNEKITFERSGILAHLCQYLGESANKGEYTLKDLLYNLPYIHRAFHLTYTSSQELFTPIEKPKYVKKDGSEESWFCAEIREDRYKNQHFINRISPEYEEDKGVDKVFVIRKKKRFKWVNGGKYLTENLKRLTEYHKTVRKSLYYICGSRTLWYIKRKNVKGLIQRSSLTLTFAAMHRLSEIARYSPESLEKHFKCRHNWLLSEFIATSPNQFLDEISAEITGQEIMVPGIRTIS